MAVTEHVIRFELPRDPLDAPLCKRSGAALATVAGHQLQPFAAAAAATAPTLLLMAIATPEESYICIPTNRELSLGVTGSFG